ncbi:MAG: sensor histidine kinase [Gemmatimonadetes bacterium]|nr:sensor histidine kinase [Gemmatimonadota bacterium]
MTIRTRLFLGATLLGLVPLAATGFLIRRDVASRLDGQVRARAEASVVRATTGLRLRARQLDRHLASLADAARADSRLRLALLDPSDAGYVRDWAPRAQELTGLDALLLLDERGEILSSGQFRNDFGRTDPAVPAFLARCGDDAGVVPLRRPDGDFLALARVDSLALSGVPLRLVGAFELSGATLAELVPDADVSATLWIGDRALLSSGGGAPDPGGLEQTVELPAKLPGTPASTPARIVVTHSLAGRRDVLRALDHRLLLAFGLAAAASLGLASFLAARLARPVERLAAKTRVVDLDHLDVDFATDRRDEIGALSRFLDEMTRRLRASVSRLRDAERRATLGDLARQVNHDLRNAFPPIRNVVKHLAEVSHRPDELARVFAERRGTLDSGLSYLDDLATNWRRLAGRAERTACDVPAIAREAIVGRNTAAGSVEFEGDPAAERVHADPTAIRRILDNLVTNACESGAARVTVLVRSDTGPPPRVHLIVEDDGPGIPEAARNRAFEAYFTTKAHGTGLGLAIVRRLVSDAEGTIAIEDRDGRGTRVHVTFPAGTVADADTRAEEGDE